VRRVFFTGGGASTGFVSSIPFSAERATSAAASPIRCRRVAPAFLVLSTLRFDKDKEGEMTDCETEEMADCADCCARELAELTLSIEGVAAVETNIDETGGAFAALFFLFTHLLNESSDLLLHRPVLQFFLAKTRQLHCSWHSYPVPTAKLDGRRFFNFLHQIVRTHGDLGFEGGQGATKLQSSNKPCYNSVSCRRQQRIQSGTQFLELKMTRTRSNFNFPR
jgi:hypothetical protein